MKAKKNGVYKGVFVASSEFMFFSSNQKIGLQIFLMNWQTEGINRNYRSVKFEGNFTAENWRYSRESFAFFRSDNKVGHRIGIRQDHYLSMREIPNHAHTRVPLLRIMYT